MWRAIAHPFASFAFTLTHSRFLSLSHSTFESNAQTMNACVKRQSDKFYYFSIYYYWVQYFNRCKWEWEKEMNRENKNLTSTYGYIFLTHFPLIFTWINANEKKVCCSLLRCAFANTQNVRLKKVIFRIFYQCRLINERIKKSTNFDTVNKIFL